MKHFPLCAVSMKCPSFLLENLHSSPLPPSPSTLPSPILTSSAARSGSDSDDESSSESSSDDDEDPPQMRTRRVAHSGGINRIRCMPQQPNVVAAWGDSGRVSVFDVADQLKATVAEPYKEQKGGPQKVNARQVFGGHSSEGWALDWSPVTAGRLLR